MTPLDHPMRHLKALITALTFFTIALALNQWFYGKIEAVHIAGSGVFALLGYCLGLKASLPVVICLAFAYSIAIHVLCEQIYAIPILNITRDSPPLGIEESFVIYRIPVFCCIFMLIYGPHPLLLLLRRLAGWKFSRWLHAWLTWLASALIGDMEWAVVNIWAMLSYIPNTNFLPFALLAFTLPLMILGLLAQWATLERCDEVKSNGYAPWRWRTLLTHHGQLLFVRILQGWIAAWPGLVIALVMACKFRDFGFLPFVVLAIVLGYAFAMLGQRMRLATVTIIFLILATLSSMPALMQYQSFFFFISPDSFPYMSWSGRLWGGMCQFCELFAPLPLLYGLISIPILYCWRRVFPWSVITWCLTVATVSILLVTLTRNLPLRFGFQYDTWRRPLGSLSFWLHWGWKDTVWQILQIQPFVIMTLALWLRRDRLLAADLETMDEY